MRNARLIYYSENQIDPGQGSTLKQLSAILSSSNRNNKTAGITGCLVFDDRWFLQLLEGDRERIWRTFERISMDERHSDVVLAEMVETPDRLFKNWWMGLARRDQDTERYFAPLSKSGILDVRSMSAASMLELMTSLAQRGLHREMT